jgi:hypothetical protein
MMYAMMCAGMMRARKGRKGRHVDEVDSTEEFLEADRDLTRQELESTVEALARKADVPGRSQQARDSLDKVQHRATDVARRNTRWIAALAVTVVVVYALVRSRRRHPDP